MTQHCATATHKVEMMDCCAGVWTHYRCYVCLPLGQSAHDLPVTGIMDRYDGPHDGPEVYGPQDAEDID